MLFALLMMYVVQAQTAFHQTTSNPTGAVVNTGIDTMTYTLSTPYTNIVIQPVITKVSGTVAGTSVLYYSVNGTNWVSTGDTLTSTNVTTNSAIWLKTANPARYWRILVTGTGTMSATAAAKIQIK